VLFYWYSLRESVREQEGKRLALAPFLTLFTACLTFAPPSAKALISATDKSLPAGSSLSCVAAGPWLHRGAPSRILGAMSALLNTSVWSAERSPEFLSMDFAGGALLASFARSKKSKSLSLNTMGAVIHILTFPCQHVWA